jgi:bifunctional enzyme CysN/CysC
VDTPIEECAARDPKGLYRKARLGEIRNFTGMDSPYEEPATPEIHLETSGKTPEEMVDAIESWLREKDVADEQYDSGGGI